MNGPTTNSQWCIMGKKIDTSDRPTVIEKDNKWCVMGQKRDVNDKPATIKEK